MCEWRVKPWKWWIIGAKTYFDQNLGGTICSQNRSALSICVYCWIISTAINQWDLAATPMFAAKTEFVCVSLKCPFPRKKLPVFSQLNWVNFHFLKASPLADERRNFSREPHHFRGSMSSSICSKGVPTSSLATPEKISDGCVATKKNDTKWIKMDYL